MDEQRIFWVLIAIEYLNVDNPIVIGVYEDRDDAYEDGRRLAADDFNVRYEVRAGVRVKRGLYETNK